MKTSGLEEGGLEKGVYLGAPFIICMREEMGGLVFVALMFIGAGIGLLFGRPDVGGAIGMGTGFLVMAYLRSRPIKVEAEKTIHVRGYWGAAILALAGIAFIAAGIGLLLNKAFIIRFTSGLVAIAIGLLFLAAAFNLVKK